MFARRAANGRLGFAKPQNKSDQCEYCHHFDSREKPLLEKILKECRQRFEDLLPGCWVLWDSIVKKEPSFNHDGFMPEASEKYLRQFMAFLSNLDNDKPEVVELAKAFNDNLSKEGGLLEVIIGYAGHWKLRDNQIKCFKKAMDSPRPRTLYVHTDFAAPASESTQCLMLRWWTLRSCV